MPTGRWELSTCVVDGKIYVIGGMDKWVGSAYRTVLQNDQYKYSMGAVRGDPTTTTWKGRHLSRTTLHNARVSVMLPCGATP
jgi:hypothetical protein